MSDRKITSPTKNIKSDLELALLFNLMFYPSQSDGWKTYDDLKKTNDSIEDNLITKNPKIIKQGKEHIFPRELHFTIGKSGGDANMPKYLQRLIDKGWVEGKYFEELDNRKRPVSKKKWRIQDRTIGGFNKVLAQFDRFAFNELFFDLVKNQSEFQKERSHPADMDTAAHLSFHTKFSQSKEYKDTLLNKYKTSLNIALMYDELIHGGVKLDRVVSDLKKEYKQTYEVHKEA